ncbi:TrmH family RNA methyltransferase [Sporosarcina contaminans]|uniref:TrmH family RNA methyltransferase n=1 Tax=Sporosarcina contaminans TaxID=633403 RepID=A0ABW3U2R8_9BACL
MKRIESAQNGLVKHWKKLATSKKDRDKSNEYIVEGFHLIEEAMKEKGSLLHLIIREDVQLPIDWDVSNIVTIEVTRAIAKELSETEQSQGVFAHCKQFTYSEEKIEGWRKYLFIDSVQDPGNVGTMIRTADAAGLDAVILGKGSADPYNPKTIRSAQGSHFHIPIVKGDLMEWCGRVKSKKIPVVGTGLKQAENYHSIKRCEQFALIVGNEGSGVASELLEQTDKVVKIPLHGKAESLNVAVATGILLYTLIEP